MDVNDAGAAALGDRGARRHGRPVEAIRTQRAIRRFRPDPVPADLLWTLLEAATKAPSGTNQQPWGFVVVQEAARRERIVEMLGGWLAGDAAFREYLENVDQIADPSRRRIAAGARGLIENLGGAPVVIVPCLYEVTSPRPDGLFAGSSIYPAVQNLLLAARGLGLGTVLTTFQWRFEAELRALLGLPPDATPAAADPARLPGCELRSNPSQAGGERRALGGVGAAANALRRRGGSGEPNGRGAAPLSRPRGWPG